MSAQKDTSRPSNGRHIRNRFHPDRATQKQITDENRGIGKLIALFAMSLILIAGVFGNAAMAADGDGSIAVDNNRGTTEPFTAGATAQTIQFTYTKPTNISMVDGLVQITFPSGWKVSNKSITIADADTNNSTDIYVTNTNGTVTTEPEAHKGRVTFKANERVEVKLNTAWTGSAARTLVLTFADVTVPIPNSLRYILQDENDPQTLTTTDDTRYAVATYEFTTKTAGKDGVLTRLKPTTDNPTPQPHIRVTNIASGKGKVEITPTISYEAETDVNFRLVFKATGPMYDIDNNQDGDLKDVADTDSDIQFNINSHLSEPTTTAGSAGYIYASGSGSVRFESGVDRITLSGSTVTINISRMDKDDEVQVRYEKVTNNYSSDSQSENRAYFDPKTRSTHGSETGNTGFENVVEDDVKGGILHRALGSGKVTLSPSPVEAGATIRKITLTYTANVKLTKGKITINTAGIVIDDPDTTTGDNAVETVLQAENSSKYGYVDSPDTTGTPTFTSLTVGSPARVVGSSIQWTNIDLDKGKTFKTTIENVKASTAEAYTWNITDANTSEATLSDLDDDKEPVLFVLETVSDAVTFSVDGTSYPAGSEQTVAFTFTATRTPISEGYVRFQIPSGWTTPTTADAAGKVTQDGSKKVESGDGARAATTFSTDKPSISGRWITLNIKRMDVGGSATATYGADTAKKAKVQYTAGTARVNGYFKASRYSPERGAGIVEIDIANVEDGSGTATVASRSGDPNTVRGGSQDDRIIVTFRAVGTMDGGKVSLELPTGWGDMQRDPTQRNYINMHASGGSLNTPDYGSRIVVANLKKFGRGATVTFTYGGGTGAQIGAEVQTKIGVADFTIKSSGEGSSIPVLLKGEEQSDSSRGGVNAGLGRVYDTAPGLLKLKVVGASDGRGTATVEIAKSNVGDQNYPDPDNPGLTKNMKRVHAADKNTYLRFTYTPVETIEEGQLQLTVPGGWTEPQGASGGVSGYTWVEAVGGADIEPATYRDSDSTANNGSGGYVTVGIKSIETGEKIIIHYGSYTFTVGDSGATAPGAAGRSQFVVSVKGTKDGSLARIRDLSSLVVDVLPQASGGGTAEITEGAEDLRAGDTKRTLKIVYTAAGEIRSGKVKLTLPDKWSPASQAHVDVSSGSVKYGATQTTSTREVEVSSVSLRSGQKLTFTYKNVTVQPTQATGVAFQIAVDGGSDPRGYVALPDLTVDVGEVRSGSGSGAITPPGIIAAGSTGNNLTFTYTAAGDISYPREFRITIPAGWSTPIKDDAGATKQGTYKVIHKRPIGAIFKDLGTTIVQKLDPVGMDMVARVRAGEMVKAKDEIIFQYQNATAPTLPEVSMFHFYFDTEPVDGDYPVVVQAANGATRLAVSVYPAIFSRDAGATHTSSTVTVRLQDDNGNFAALTSALAVTLSSSSATGTFTPASITITAGSSEGTASYTDTALGVATLTASASGLTSATATVEVTTDLIAITAARVDKTIAKAGDTVTVTANGTPSRTMTFSIGSVVTDAAMTESAAAGGTYTGTYTPVAGSHDGTHQITVALNGTSLPAGVLVVDTTAPTVTASASPTEVTNGDTVTITAGVSDGSGSGVASVSADVSMLDTTQTAAIALTGTDSYSGSFTISPDNTAANGMQTLTVTAMDAAGNSATGSATVTLNNSLSYTATLPPGISLFHVPLEVEGLNTVNDLKAMLGSSANLLITYDGSAWNSRSGGVPITSSLGVLVSMGAETTVTFEGIPWSDGSISLKPGNNLIGLPLNDGRVTNVSDIISLFNPGVVSGVIVSSGGEFNFVATAGAPGDGPVMGHAAYLVMATAAGSATVTGDGWSNRATGAAPIALDGYTVENQTPVLNLHGSVIDEITGVAQEGFRVKVKNLSTKAALNQITSVEEVDGYNLTFVDLTDAHAARVGDVLEISADSANPLIGVKPVRHVVTVDDVKASRIQLEDLIAYEIPAKTELLRNYPNPFNPETWIPYRLSEDADVSLTIYDVNGELVRTIDIGHQTAAVYESRAKAIYWDGRNRFGEQVASGVYFYSLSAGDFSATRKLVILK